MLKKISESQWYPSMRGAFGAYLYNLMIDNEKIVVVTMDLGYGLFDKIAKDFPDRFYNIGASEQCGVGLCVGLALQGLIPICYSITPFLLWRPAETIRLYVNHESIPVILIGSGRDKDYAHDGFSHDGSDDKEFIAQFKNIKSVWPETTEEMKVYLKWATENNKPMYINLTR